MGRPRTTYARKVGSTRAVAIAGPQEPGKGGELIGMFEVESLANVQIEVSTDPALRFGDGIRLAAASAAGEVGGRYYQGPQNPGPYEWYAIAASGADHDVRVHDSRRPKP